MPWACWSPPDPSCSGCGLLRELADEAGDAAQAAVGCELAHIDSRHRHRAVRPDQLPGETQLVVVSVDPADSAEDVPGKLGVDGGHHVADGGVALGLDGGIDPTPPGRPGSFDETGPV